MANEILTPAMQFISGANLPTGFIDSSHQATAVAAALERLNGGRPRILWNTLTGAGASTFDLSTLTGYTDRVSVVQAVFYPWVLGNEDDSEIDLDYWSVIQDPTTGDTLYLRQRTPASPEKVLVQYTTTWTEATVPVLLVYKVAKLAAANLCRMIAAKMAQSNDSTISVDTFGRNTAASDWLRMAKDFESEYERAMGASADDGVPPVSATMQIEVRPDPFHPYKGPYPTVGE